MAKETLTPGLAGPHAILEALKTPGRKVERIYSCRGFGEGALQEIYQLAKSQGVPIIKVTRERLEQIAHTPQHQGLWAPLASFTYETEERVIELALKQGQAGLLLILDGVQDPHNLGAIMRTAEAVGAAGLIIPRHRAAGLTASAIKAAAGAQEYVPVARGGNLAQLLSYLKEKGFWVVGADPSAKKDIYGADFRQPLALVIGSEGEGIRPLVKKNCDLLVKIPQKGKIASLNTSVATAVILYEVLRQRQKSEKN